MSSCVRQCLSIGVLALIVPTIGFTSTVTINGTTIGGPVDALGSGTFSYNLSVNGDPYTISGSYSSTYDSTNGPSYLFSPTAVYNGITPIAQTDVLHVNWEQQYSDVDPLFLAAGGEYDVTASSTINGASGSYWREDSSINGNTFPTIGPFTGPNSGTASYIIIEPGLTSPLDLNLDYTFSYAQGSFAATPEPADALPVGIALGVICIVSMRQRLSLKMNNAT